MVAVNNTSVVVNSERPIRITIVGNKQLSDEYLKERMETREGGFLSFLFSVWLYFIADQKQAGIFVGLWVPSIHSLGTLLLTTVRRPELVPVAVARSSDSDRVGS